MSSEKPNLTENSRNFLTEEDIEELKKEFNVQEEGPNLFIEKKDEKGGFVRYYFPKKKKYPRAEEAGGGFFDLKEHIREVRKKWENK